MPRKPLEVALAIGSATLVGGAVAWGIAHWLSSRREGAILCPPTEINTLSLAPGDFIVVQLGTKDGKPIEITWATVQSLTDTQIVARLTGEHVDEGPKPLATDRHGFELGDTIVVARTCVWEVFAPVSFPGRVVCGPDLETFGASPMPQAATLGIGDSAKVVLADLESASPWTEQLWTRVVSISSTGQIVTAQVDEEPTVAAHGLRIGALLRFNRDCVIDIL